MEGDAFRPVTSTDGLIDDMVNAIAEDRYGGLWFGSYVAPRGGVSVLRDGRWYRFALADGLPHANVTCFLATADGSMWVGTGFHDRGGAVRFDVPESGTPRIAETLSRADGLAGEKVRSLYQDEAGDIWFGSERDGIAVRTPSGFRVITSAEGMSDNEAKAVVAGRDDMLWLGTRSGITLVRDPRVVTGR
jgi:ligand-binding sensor domain-containing protein